MMSDALRLPLLQRSGDHVTTFCVRTAAYEGPSETDPSPYNIRRYFKLYEHVQTSHGYGTVLL